MTKRRRKTVEFESTVTIRSNLADLVAQKGKREGKKIPIAHVARDTGIALNTIKRYLRGGEGSFNGPNVAILCRYLGCEIGDLLKIVDVGESADTQD